MAEEIKETKAKKEVTVIKNLVVKELPTEVVKNVHDDKGIEYNLMTTEEALTLILEKVTKIEKSIA